jgi:hypothetical protein
MAPVSIGQHASNQYGMRYQIPQLVVPHDRLRWLPVEPVKQLPDRPGFARPGLGNELAGNVAHGIPIGCQLDIQSIARWLRGLASDC